MGAKGSIGDKGGRGSRGESMSAEKAKAAKDTKKSMAATERRRSSVMEVKDKKGRRKSTDAEGKGSFGTGRRKSGEMSKESKMKQKKAEETALRKNKVIYYIYVPKYSKCKWSCYNNNRLV